MEKLIDVALGNLPADMVIKGGKVVNVLTGEIYNADVAIKGKWIAAVGQVDYTIGEETTIINAQGKYLTPGLIDQHCHIHESQLSVPQYAAAVLARGTTAVCTDFYGESVIAGIKAVKTSLELAKKTPLKILFVLPIPAYYQNIPFGSSGLPSKEEMLEMLDWQECIGSNDTFGEKIIVKDEFFMELLPQIKMKGKKICGHGSELSGKELIAWAAYAQNTDDHECVSPDEALEKARLGIKVSAREGSGCSNLSEVCRAITEFGINPRQFTFNTDLISPTQIVREGHIDNAVRKAIKIGINPVTAIQMATINAAECLKVSDFLGSIAPGKVADVLIVDKLSDFSISKVIANGIVVAADGKLAIELPPCDYPEFARNTVKLGRTINDKDFDIRAEEFQESVLVRVIKASGESLITEEGVYELPVQNGIVKNDIENDILKIAAIERVTGTGEIGVGFIKGFGLKKGAIATTYNSQQQNMIIVGTNDEDMAFAANHLAKIGGGFLAVDSGKVVGELPLPLYGLLSDEPLDTVLQKLDSLYDAVSKLGCGMKSPFHTLGFMGLPVSIGKLKICPKGLVNVWKEQIVDVIVREP